MQSGRPVTSDYRGSRARIDNLLLDASLFYHPSRSDSTGVILRKLSVDGIGMKFRAGGTAWDVLRDARVKGNMHGSINLGTLTELFPSKQKGIVAHGIVGIDADLACRLSELTPRRIGQTVSMRWLRSNDMLVDMPQDTLRLVANGTPDQSWGESEPSGTGYTDRSRYAGGLS